MGLIVPLVIVWIDKKIQKHRPADAVMEDLLYITLLPNEN